MVADIVTVCPYCAAIRRNSTLAVREMHYGTHESHDYWQCHACGSLAGCQAQQVFGSAWYQIDAPRHLAIPSLAGMKALVRSLGLRLQSVIFDSTASQFSVSRGYQLGLSMKQQMTQAFSHVSAAEMRSFEAMADEANLRGTGDQAIFIIKRP